MSVVKGIGWSGLKLVGLQHVRFEAGEAQAEWPILALSGHIRIPGCARGGADREFGPAAGRAIAPRPARP